MAANVAASSSWSNHSWGGLPEPEMHLFVLCSITIVAMLQDAFKDGLLYPRVLYAVH